MSNAVIYTAIFSVVLGLIGSTLFIIGIVVLINKKIKKIKCTLKVYGKVTNIVRKKNYDIHFHTCIYRWYPVFEYNIGELKFTRTSLYGSSLPRYEKIGQNVELYFNPRNFNEYYVKEETQIEISGKTFVISGVVLITVAVFSAIVMLNLI